MTACERDREQIEALLDGELEAGERAALEAHIAGCAGCRKALADRRQLAAAFAALPAVEPAPDFEARFWARIAREREAPVGLAARLGRGLSPGRALALAAAAAAGLALILNLPRAPEPSATPEPTVAAEVVVEPPRTLARAAPPAPAPDVRVLASEQDFELLQDDAVDAISELDVLEEWNDAGPS